MESDEALDTLLATGRDLLVEAAFRTGAFKEALRTATEDVDA